MNKRFCTASKTVGAITARAAIASLIVLQATAHASALAQTDQGQASRTMQRLQQLQQIEHEKKAAEDAKWRSFRGTDPGPTLLVRPYSNTSTCEFYWPGWELRQDGVRTTMVRGCIWQQVAVDCRSLKTSWYQSWNKRIPGTEQWSKWEIPNLTTDIGIQTSNMVAALCDGMINSAPRSTPPQGSIAREPVRNEDLVPNNITIQSPKGWRLVGINSKAAVWWIKPSSATGGPSDRTVLKLSLNPDRPAKLLESRVYINCPTAQMQQTISLESQIRTPPLLINKGGTWDTIARLICPKGSYAPTLRPQPMAPFQ